MARKDGMLAPMVSRFRGLRVTASPTPFEALVTAVLSQQVNLTFAYSIKKALVESFGRKCAGRGAPITRFPSHAGSPPESGGDARLPAEQREGGHLDPFGREVRRRPALRGLDALSDDQVVERLTAIKGIGRWSAEIALMRGLGRPDTFPAGDLGVVKYVAQGLLGKTGKATEEEMRAFAERWRPYRGLALAYCYAEHATRRGSTTPGIGRK